MRHWLALLMLFTLVPVLDVMAAPAPEPYAILEIESPPKGGTSEEHCKKQIDGILMSPYGYYVIEVFRDPEVRKLPSIALKKDPLNLIARDWIAKNLRITSESEGNRLKLKFRAGNRTEQVVILNSLLRSYLRAGKESQEWIEKCLRWEEDCVIDLEKRIKTVRDQLDIAPHRREYIAEYQKGIDDLRSDRIPERRAEIARYKQITVIKWAR